MRTDLTKGGVTAILSGGGFIGTELTKLFAEDRPVLVVDHRKVDYRHANIAQIDSNDKAAFFEAFPNLTACIDLTVENAGIDLFFEGVRQSHNKPKFIYASSSAIYGDQPENKLVKETAESLANNEYGLQKREAEIKVETLAEENGVPFTIARIFNVYGEGQDTTRRMASVIGKFAKAIAQGNELTTMNHGEQVRDFLHVHDIAQAFKVMTDQSDLVGTYNLGSGEGVSMSGLIERLESISGIKAIVADKQGSGGIVYSVADMSALFAASSFKPSVSLNDGLERVWEKVVAGT